jgi:hypothetical protein
MLVFFDWSRFVACRWEGTFERHNFSEVPGVWCKKKKDLGAAKLLQHAPDQPPDPISELQESSSLTKAGVF